MPTHSMNSTLVTIEMDTEEAKWLKSRYEETANGEPAQKRVKFEIIKEEMQAEFPQKTFCARTIPGSSSRKHIRPTHYTDSYSFLAFVSCRVSVT